MAGSTTLTLAPDAYSGRRLGKYEILCRLSLGGMSEIFLAFQRGLAGFRKFVVLKQILPDIKGEEEFVRMFLDEARITAAFSHPNIAQVFDLDIQDDELFLAMEFVPGATLVEVARACRQMNEPIPIGFTLQAVRDTALALHYAHNFTDPMGRAVQVIHRDIAEKNIMVTYDGTTKLLDFGIAKALNRSSRTSVGMVKGTSGYMSPEQILGEELDPRSDLFSLGVVFHECLTAMRLFHGKSAEEAMMHALKGEIAPPSKQNPLISPELDQVVLRALRRARQERYASGLELAREIERVAGNLIWHPEQTAQFTQRLFADRREQTRTLMSQAHSQENTGEFKLARFLSADGSFPAAPVEPPPLVARRSSTRPAVPLDAPRTPRTPRPAASQPREAIDPVPPLVEPPRRRGRGFGLDDVTAPGVHPPTDPGEAPEMASEDLTLPAGSLTHLLMMEEQTNPGSRSPAPLRAPPPVATPAEFPSAVMVDPSLTLEPEPTGKMIGGEVTASLSVHRPRRRGGAWALVVVAALAVVGGGYALELHLDLQRELAQLWGDGTDSPADINDAVPLGPHPTPELSAEGEAVPAPAPEVEAAPEAEPAPDPAPVVKVEPEKTPAKEPVKVAPTRSKPRVQPKRATTAPAASSTASAPSEGVKEAQAAPSHGTLTLITEPWSTVFLGQRELGVTPLVKQKLPAGRHLLRLVGPDKRPVELSVEIASGEEAKVRVPLSVLKAL